MIVFRIVGVPVQASAFTGVIFTKIRFPTVSVPNSATYAPALTTVCAAPVVDATDACQKRVGKRLPGPSGGLNAIRQLAAAVLAVNPTVTVGVSSATSVTALSAGVSVVSGGVIGNPDPMFWLWVPTATNI